MNQKLRIVALVPMRDQSERVPGKNYRPLGGKPLFHYIMNTLLKCPEIDEIVVDTDSARIQDSLKSDFPSVQLIKRADQLIGGDVPMNSILLSDTAQVEADYYVQTHCTNPLLRAETVSRAIETFLDSTDARDSLFTVTELHTRLYDVEGRALNHNPVELLRTQDLPPIFEENSCLYIFSRNSLKTNGHRIGQNPLMFTIPREEALDIDEEEDFQLADFLIRQRQGRLRE